MIFQMFSIYDRVSGLYSEPFYALKRELAIRKFNYLMSNSSMVKDDCELYEVGSFDCSVGLGTYFDKPDFVCKYQEVNNV